MILDLLKRAYLRHRLCLNAGLILASLAFVSVDIFVAVLESEAHDTAIKPYLVNFHDKDLIRNAAVLAIAESWQVKGLQILKWVVVGSYLLIFANVITLGVIEEKEATRR